jgi:hypothetical protein
MDGAVKTQVLQTIGTEDKVSVSIAELATIGEVVDGLGRCGEYKNRPGMRIVSTHLYYGTMHGKEVEQNYRSCNKTNGYSRLKNT